MSGFNWDALPKANTDKSFDWDALEAADKPSMLDSAGRGLAQGATLGFRDEGAGAVSSPAGFRGALKEIANKMGAHFSDEDIETYKKERDASRALDDAAKKENPTSFLVGELGGGVAASLAVPGLGVAGDAGLAGTVGKSALQGATFGLGGSDAEDAKGLARDTALGAAAGGVAGAAGYGVGKAASAVANKVGNTISRTSPVFDQAMNEFNDFGSRLAKDGRTTDAVKGVVKTVEDIGNNKGATASAVKNLVSPRVASAGAITTDFLASMAAKAPEALGKFGNILQQAAKRGPQAVAATHFILEQTNPEYREKTKELLGQEGP